MTYDLFQQSPGTIILTIIISLVYTIIEYCTFPLIFAKVRKREITKKKYNTICYGFNFLIYVFSFFLGFASNPTPYLLWTCVFSSVGLKTLAKKGIVIGYESNTLEDDPNRITECKSCGYQSKTYFEACPQCGKHAKRYVYLNDNNQL